MALVASLASGTKMNWVDGLFYDLSLATNGVRPGTGGEPVAVIAMDRSSLDSEELIDIPRVLFGPFWAKLIDGLAEAHAPARVLTVAEMLEQLDSTPPASARGAIDALLALIDPDDNVRDDIAILSAQVRPEAGATALNAA